MGHRHENFLRAAKKSARPNNKGLVTLSQDPITQMITLPDGTPVNQEPFYQFGAAGDLGDIVREAEIRASRLHFAKDCISAVFYRQHDDLKGYAVEYYSIPKNS